VSPATPRWNAPLTAVGLIGFVDVVPAQNAFLASLEEAGPPRSDG
jgi:hypothetical protein